LPFAIDAMATIGVAVWFTRYLRNEPMRRAAGASPASATRAEAPQRESRP
jgi:hypothetical protein